MATRSEQFRATEARHGQSEGAAQRRAARSKPGATSEQRSRSKVHADKKATYALEPATSGRPSRKSTRKSANRSKPDTAFNLTEQLKKGSPEARFRRARAQSR